MLLAKNFLVLAVLTTGAYNASASNNLRAVERALYGYDSPYSESVTIEQNTDTEKEKKKDDTKIKGVSSLQSSSEDSSSEESSYIGSKGNVNYNHGYSKGSINEHKYKVYGLSKGSYPPNEDSAALQPPGREGTKKKTATIITRKPRPYKRPSNWVGDGHSKPPSRAPVEPIETPQPTDWKGDGFEPVVTPQPTDWKDDGFEPVVTPQPTDWKDDGFEPVITPVPTPDPTPRPTARPSNKPTRFPTNKPSNKPTNKPTSKPTAKPTDKPTMKPTAYPSKKPSPAPVEPVITPEPTLWNGDGHLITPAPTKWNGDGHTTHPTEFVPKETPEPTLRPSLRPTTKKPVTPEPTVLEPVETPEPSAYYYTDAPTMYYQDSSPTTADPITKPSSGSSNNMPNSFPGFPGFDETMPNFSGSQWRKEVDEQCEQVVVNDVCVDRCVVVTSIFQGTALIDESSRVRQSSCMSKRQESKQDQ